MKTILTMTIPSHNCIVRVRHPDAERPFRVSFMRDSFDCLMCAKGFHVGEKPPKRGKHLLLTGPVRNWIAELEPIETP